MQNARQPLPKSTLIPLGSTTVASAVDAGKLKKTLRSGWQHD